MQMHCMERKGWFRRERRGGIRNGYPLPICYSLFFIPLLPILSTAHSGHCQFCDCPFPFARLPIPIAQEPQRSGLFQRGEPIDRCGGNRTVRSPSIAESANPSGSPSILAWGKPGYPSSLWSRSPAIPLAGALEGQLSLLPEVYWMPSQMIVTSKEESSKV